MTDAILERHGHDLGRALTEDAEHASKPQRAVGAHDLRPGLAIVDVFLQILAAVAVDTRRVDGEQRFDVDPIVDLAIQAKANLRADEAAAHVGQRDAVVAPIGRRLLVVNFSTSRRDGSHAILMRWIGVAFDQLVVRRDEAPRVEGPAVFFDQGNVGTGLAWDCQNCDCNGRNLKHARHTDSSHNARSPS